MMFAVKLFGSYCNRPPLSSSGANGFVAPIMPAYSKALYKYRKPNRQCRDE